MYYVDGVVLSAGNDLQNVVADDWRCLKLERSSLPDTVALCCRDIGGLLHQACTGPGLPHRASASRHVESATVLGRTCACRDGGVHRPLQFVGQFEVAGFICYRNIRESVFKRQIRCLSHPLGS